ncbi:hypothetical protein [Streptomyces sp. NPDC050485]|uniref:hypothetical protein n=1 Tax=Streptomyces sp. NPDC050485 TaxID=3365617 RepID=UPI0037A99C3C
MSDVQNSPASDDPRSARILGYLLGRALRPLARLVNPLVRRGYTTFAGVIVGAIVCAAVWTSSYGLLTLAPALPLPLMLLATLSGALFAVLGGLGGMTLLFTAPVWILSGFTEPAVRTRR